MSPTRRCLDLSKAASEWGAMLENVGKCHQENSFKNKSSIKFVTSVNHLTQYGYISNVSISEFDGSIYPDRFHEILDF